MKKIPSLGLAAVLALGFGAACADDNVVKVGLTLYDTHSRTDGINGPGVPPGADATTDNATTIIFVYERIFRENFGVELVVGIPPTIQANATGSVAFLGDDILSAKNLAPTLLFNYHFGAPGATWRPYLGAGVNYTHFSDVRSTLAPDVKMGNSTGLALQAGITYAVTRDVGVFASVAKIDVKSKVVASGATVLTTRIDFRPIVYSAGVSYQF